MINNILKKKYYFDLAILVSIIILDIYTIIKYKTPSVSSILWNIYVILFWYIMIKIILEFIGFVFKLFNDAVRAWYDPDRLDFFDDEHNLNETRWTFLGAMTGVVLFVVETEPCEDTVRIISARRASKHEQEVYYANREENY